MHLSHIVSSDDHPVRNLRKTASYLFPARLVVWARPPITQALHRRHRVRITLRSETETIKSLRATLKQLEQTTDTARDSVDFAQLKRIFRKRIVELEIERARAMADKHGYRIAS